MASAAPEPERDSRRGAPEGQFGNVAHEYDEAIAQKVREMAASGCGWKTMSRILELSIPTLMKHYQRDFWRARSMASANVGQAVYKAAVGARGTAQEVLLTVQTARRQSGGRRHRRRWRIRRREGERDRWREARR